jgi:hypothetical protein
VGVWKNDGVEVIRNDIGHRTTPSYVAFTDSDRLLADAAENEAVRNPENTVFDAKRLIGRKFNDPTCAGVWKNDGVEVIANDRGSRTTPSYVAFTDSDRLLGDAAENRAACNPELTAFDAKRLIGRKFNDPFATADAKLGPLKVESGVDEELVTVVDLPGETKTFHSEEVSAVILAKMKEATEAYLGSEVGHAVVTVSATVRNDKWCLSQFEIDREVSEADPGREEQLKEKFEGGDEEAIGKAVQETLEGGDWLHKNRLAEKDELEAKQKKFDVMKVHQAPGGGSSVLGSLGAVVAGGPTVEEVDSLTSENQMCV